MNHLDNKYPVSTVCVDKGYCAQPFTELTDPQPVPTYVINLDLPPVQRCMLFVKFFYFFFRISPSFSTSCSSLIKTKSVRDWDLFQLLIRHCYVWSSWCIGAFLWQQLCHQRFGQPHQWVLLPHWICSGNQRLCCCHGRWVWMVDLG